MSVRLPIKTALEAYAGAAPARFHMPGHKGFLSALDVTEVTGTDDLHSPSGAILESERLCAVALGARDAFFLVNGSTAGNLAMLYLAGMGKRILLGRNCHKSVVNGLALMGQETVPLFPDEDGVFDPANVDELLEKTPCSAVFITSPTYSGAVSPIAEIAEAAHRHGAKLLVDCAHGAHFAYSNALPPVPKEADAWCVSCHKTLEALTQSAVLLTGDAAFGRDEVQRALNLFQSTSPSYELMLSIERSVLAPRDWDAHIQRIDRVRRELERIENVTLERGSAVRDVTRLNISFRGMNGCRLASELEARGIFPEMADSACVTLITSPADPDEWYERLYSALRGIRPDGSAIDGFPAGSYERIAGEAALPVREAVTAPRELVPLGCACGRIAAGAVGCYPPGVAVLFPGERIGTGAMELLMNESRAGARLFGTEGGLIPVVRDEKDE